MIEEYEHKRRARDKGEGAVAAGFRTADQAASAGHVYVENITVESLAQVLAQAPRGVLMIRDELTSMGAITQPVPIRAGG